MSLTIWVTSQTLKNMKIPKRSVNQMSQRTTEVGFQAGVDKPIVAPAATAASEVRTYLMLLILL